MNTDNHFLSPILIIRIHPAQKAISYTIKLPRYAKAGNIPASMAQPVSLLRRNP
jgi:hypothetical protein